jgi:HEAT repeat protein
LSSSTCHTGQIAPMAKALTALIALLAAAAAPDEAWDRREERFVREQLYLQIQHLPDLPAIKQTFEKALSGDASAAPELARLVAHANQHVAGAAAQALGRFPGELASTTLRRAYARDARPLVRSDALAGLARFRDPATSSLAKAALSDPSIVMQGGGLGALRELGDGSNSAAILKYMDRVSPGEADGDILEMVGKLGDPPGSSVVRDRLVAEVNRKTNDLDTRYGAARGLKAMGLEKEAKPILDVVYAKDAWDSCRLVHSAIGLLAKRKGRAIAGQADVDALFREVDVGKNHRQDLWGRPLRLQFVSTGTHRALSDGPDLKPGTADDISSAESFDDYSGRVFADRFLDFSAPR